MKWQLVKVKDVAFVRDNSDTITFIHARPDGVRVDVMTGNNEPLISFEGHHNDVRKALMQWIDERISQKAGCGISIEHAAYLGCELARAEMLKENFVQG